VRSSRIVAGYPEPLWPETLWPEDIRRPGLPASGLACRVAAGRTAADLPGGGQSRGPPGGRQSVAHRCHPSHVMVGETRNETEPHARTPAGTLLI